MCLYGQGLSGHDNVTRSLKVLVVLLAEEGLSLNFWIRRVLNAPMLIALIDLMHVPPREGSPGRASQRKNKKDFASYAEDAYY